MSKKMGTFYISNDYVTNKNKEFFDSIAQEYDGRLELYHPFVIERLRSVFEKYIFNHFPAKKEMSVLDVGCGTGYLEQFFTDKAAVIDGIDISSEMLAITRSKFPIEKYPKFNFSKKDVYNLQEDNRQYDIVMANSFLHHCKDYDVALALMATKVKKGGVLFIGMEPNRFIYKYFFFLISIFRWLQRKKIKNEDFNEKIAEWHIFNGEGIDFVFIKRSLKNLGFSKIRYFSSWRQTLAKIQETFEINLFSFFPNIFLDNIGIFSQLFHCVAYKDE